MAAPPPNVNCSTDERLMSRCRKVVLVPLYRSRFASTSIGIGASLVPIDSLGFLVSYDAFTFLLIFKA